MSLPSRGTLSGLGGPANTWARTWRLYWIKCTFPYSFRTVRRTLHRYTYMTFSDPVKPTHKAAGNRATADGAKHDVYLVKRSGRRIWSGDHETLLTLTLPTVADFFCHQFQPWIRTSQMHECKHELHDLNLNMNSYVTWIENNADKCKTLVLTSAILMKRPRRFCLTSR